MPPIRLVDLNGEVSCTAEAVLLWHGERAKEETTHHKLSEYVLTVWVGIITLVMWYVMCCAVKILLSRQGVDVKHHVTDPKLADMIIWSCTGRELLIICSVRTF